MDKAVVDTSVVVKWVAKEREQEREAALRIYDSVVAGYIDAWTPAFLLVETANILKQKKGLPQKEVLRMLKEITETGMHFTTLSVAEAPEIVSVAFTYKITAYDALYIYLAKKLACKLLTFDSRLLAIRDICLTPSALLDLSALK